MITYIKTFPIKNSELGVSAMYSFHGDWGGLSIDELVSNTEIRLLELVLRYLYKMQQI